MSRFNEKHVPDELQHVVDQLRTERPEASAVELDEIKLRAMARAKDARTLSSGKGRPMRGKLVSLLIAAGVLATGAGTMAVAGGFPHGHSHSSGKHQYCPPKHGHHGKPKKHKRCKHGPKPGHGHHGGHGDDDDGHGHGHHSGHHFWFWYHGHWFWHW